MPPTSPPNLKSAIAKAVIDHHDQIDRWFADKFKDFPPAFYCSVDIRDSGDKVAPVDCNLYPGGFNNICEVDLEHASALLREELQKISLLQKIPLPERIGIIPENHTENRFYLENLYVLKSILENAGLEVEVMRLEDLPGPLALQTASEKRLLEHPLRTTLNRAHLDSGWTPDWLILNCDFSAGYPEFLNSLTQPIFPSQKLGWHSRKKSAHFDFYNKLADEFASLIGIDPWRIKIESEPVGEVNFSDEIGTDRVFEVAKAMLERITAQYQSHSIDRKPALFIKNDSGTYGMGIMVIHSAEELLSMNRRTKNKMSTGKNKSAITQVLVQEGIPTQLSAEGSTSEPVIYMMGETLIGGFIRANPERSDMENLNSQGMFFKKLCFKDLSDCLGTRNFSDLPTLEAVYGTIAKLSALAAAMELRQALSS